jgi:hypothetical protein
VPVDPEAGPDTGIAVVDASGLDQVQRELLAAWFPGSVVVADLAWPSSPTAVVELRAADGGHHVVKAVRAGADRTHLDRELTAHRQWLGPWQDLGRGPVLEHADDVAGLLVTRHLPGRLVQGTSAASDPGTYRQAGALLAALHGQSAELDDGAFEREQRTSALTWLDRPHRIPVDTAEVLRATVEGWPTPPARLVPTHGDWQPRNWLVHDDVIEPIDLGRAALRPASTDLARLSAQSFRSSPALEVAFFDGYGPDPRDPDAWLRHRIREAIGTAAWAFQVGDVAFERQGLRMIAEVVAELPGGA